VTVAADCGILADQEVCIMTFWDLKPGVRVRIKQAFADFDGQVVESGVRVVASHDCFFYDDGHTLKFTDGSVIRLSGNDPANEPIMKEAVDAYWEILPAEGP
jgi:hypothetical protein